MSAFHRPIDIENMHPLCIPYGICDGDDQQKLALLTPSSPPSSTTANFSLLHNNQMSLFSDDLDHVGHSDLHSPDEFGLDYDGHHDVSFNSDDIFWSHSNGIFGSSRRPLKMNTVFQVVDSADIKSGPTLAQLNLNHSDDNDPWDIDLLSYHHHYHHHHHHQQSHIHHHRVIGRKSFEGHHPFCSSYNSILKPCSVGHHSNCSLRFHPSTTSHTFDSRTTPFNRLQCCLGHNIQQQNQATASSQPTALSHVSTTTCRAPTPAIRTSSPTSSASAQYCEKRPNPRLKEDIDYLATLICGSKTNQDNQQASNNAPVSSLAKSCSTLAQSLSTGPKLLDCSFNNDRKPTSAGNEHIINQTPSSSSPHSVSNHKNQSNAISNNFSLEPLNVPLMNETIAIKMDINSTSAEKNITEQPKAFSVVHVNSSLDCKMKCNSSFESITSSNPHYPTMASSMKPQNLLIQTTTVLNEQKNAPTMLSSLLNSGSLASRNLSHCNSCHVLTDVTTPQTTSNLSHSNGIPSSHLNHQCQRMQSIQPTPILNTFANNSQPDNFNAGLANYVPTSKNPETGTYQQTVMVTNTNVTTPSTQLISSLISSTSTVPNRPSQPVSVNSAKGVSNFFTQPASPSASSTTSSINDNAVGQSGLLLSTTQTTVHKNKNQTQRFRHNSMSTDCSMSSHDEGFASQVDADDNGSDSDDDEMSSDDESFYGDYSNNDLIGASISDDAENKWTLNMGRSRRNGQKRYFWQYNVQSKGPKGTRISSLGDTQDPHILPEASDPVFSNDCQVEGVKHSGKARRGDGNDLTPNPRKLLMIGLELKKLGKIINELAPVTDVPINARYKTRKEKNKLASRACRLKKKAQHEANKIKLYGLQHEHRQIVTSIGGIRKLLRESLADSYHKKHNVNLVLHSAVKAFSDKCSMKVAGQTSDYVNGVLDKVVSGIIDGGLNHT